MTQVPSEKELQVFPVGVEPTTVWLNNTTDADWATGNSWQAEPIN